MSVSVRVWPSLCFLVANVFGQDDFPPGTYQLTPEIDLNLQPVAVPIPSQFGDLDSDLVLNLPPGFTANIFAAGGMDRPRFLAFDEDGVLHVADMGGREEDSRIFAFPDRDRDGVADERILVADDIKWMHSLAFYNGDMYAAETHRITRFRDQDGDGSYETRETVVDDIPSFYYHWTRTIVFDEEKGKMYLSVGSPCDLCRQREAVEGQTTTPLPISDEWGTILEFNVDGSGRRVFANGIRNVVGLTRHPATGELWGTHNHYDRGGGDIPPEWIDIIRDGDFMGYPLVYGFQTWVDFSHRNYEKILPITREDTLLAQQQKRPAALVAAHLAPMGIEFYTHDQFPQMYRNAAFVALHAGLAERKLALVPGYKVIVLFSEPDGSNARIADFMTGLERGPKQSDIWGWPMGLATVPPEPFPTAGYVSLRFAFHPGDVRKGDMNVVTNDRIYPRVGGLVGLGLLDLQQPEWQEVEIPLASLRFDGSLTDLDFSGNWTGAFYLDDVRLVAARLSPEGTAVVESSTSEHPPDFELHQNFPNPFNSETVLRFDLPRGADVDLALYNLAGQRVATLGEGQRSPGRYTVRWDGRDGHGRDLASGVYVYRLRARLGARLQEHSPASCCCFVDPNGCGVGLTSRLP